jgi:hypothetical protein
MVVAGAFATQNVVFVLDMDFYGIGSANSFGAKHITKCTKVNILLMASIEKTHSCFN